MVKIFVPGRLCLFGEHTDWAGHYRTMNADVEIGAAIVTGIEQGIYAEVEKSNIFKMSCSAPELDTVWEDFSCRMNDRELRNIAKSGSFFCYCAGVASYMLEWYKDRWREHPHYRNDAAAEERTFQQRRHLRACGKGVQSAV